MWKEGIIGVKDNPQKLIGVNSGSLPHDLREKVEKGELSRSAALSETAARECAVFDELNFDQFVVSMKASSVAETIEANEDFASKYNIPLHVGVTEAGPLVGHAALFIVLIILLVFGHGLNMILKLLSVIVHGVRLNTLEFSNHLGMSWAGFKYEPLKE